MKRTAHCVCGALTVAVDGDPQSVVACHCTECQRRTGSVFGVGAYFDVSQVTVHGAATEFTRGTDAGNRFVTRFCPICGTSLVWTSDKHPGRIGIAVGAFADPSFPAPERSVWERSMHPWARIPTEHHFAKGRT